MGSLGHPARANQTSRLDLLIAAAVWLLFTAAAATVVGYGIDLSDEGYIVYPAVQVYAGLVPYRDINSLYTPLTWYLHAGVFALRGGVDLLAQRVFFGGVLGLNAALVYLLARQGLPRWLALVPVFSLGLLVPIPQVWSPYPAWYALVGLLGALVALGRWVDDRRRLWLLLAGLGTAVAFATKPNLGVFALMAFGAFFVLRAEPLGLGPWRSAPSLGFPTALVHALVVAVVAGAVWLLIRAAATPGNQVLLAGGVVVVAASLAEWRGSTTLAHVVGAARPYVWLLLAFVLATVPWYAALSLAAGPGLTFDTIFRQGARTAFAFYQPIYLPNRDAYESLAWILGGAVAALATGWAARSRRVRGQQVAAVVGAGAVLATGFVLWRSRGAGVSPFEYVWHNLATRLERTSIEETDVLMFLPFASLLGAAGVSWLRRRAGLATEPITLRLQLLALFGALFIFQLYPHASTMHLLFSIAPFLVLLALLRGEVWRACAARVHHPAGRAAVAALLLIFPAMLVPTAVRTRADALRQNATLAVPGGSLEVSTGKRDEVAFLRDQLRDLPQSAPIFAYPAVPMAYLLTGHPNPTRESYLPAGYVDADRQGAVVERLEATATRFVLWDQDLVTRWGLYAHDRVLVDYLWQTYEPVAAERTWVLLERRR